jgi:hypothetical protein
MYFLKDPEAKVAKKKNIALIGGGKPLKARDLEIIHMKAIHCYSFIENNVYKL